MIARCAKCLTSSTRGKSGALDADELKVALRVALGDDLSIEDCRGLVRSADRDGNGVVDFEEFGFICRGQV